MAGKPSSILSIAVGAGAGIASALGFAALIGGTSLAFPLFLIAGLPVVLASLGWGSLAGLAAAAVATLAIGFGLTPQAGGTFLLMTGAPLLILSHLLGLSREETGVTHWFPLSRILMVAVVLVAAGSLFVGWMVDMASPATQDAFAAMLTAMMAADGLQVADPVAQGKALAALIVAIVPVLMPLVWLLVVVLNLWLGAHITRISQRLARPWEDLAAIALPGRAGIVLAVTLLLVVGGGPSGLIAAPLLGCLLAVHILVGLAVLHMLTRGNSLRGPLLALTWLASLVFTFPALLLVLTALADSVFHFRRARTGTA